MGTLYPSNQPAVKTPNRVSQPVKHVSMHCADLHGARVARRKSSLESHCLGTFPFLVNLLNIVPSSTAIQTLYMLTSGHRAAMTLFSARSIGSWVSRTTKSH